VAKKQKPRSPAEWLDAPEEHDFPAAIEYLSLLFPESGSASIVESLRSVPTIHRKAKDLLRASRLELLPVADPEVRKDLNRVASGGRLSPVLLVRGRGSAGVSLIVADGYHRICASYHLDEDTEIACRLVDSP
jgi:hypothetical protein